MLSSYISGNPTSSGKKLAGKDKPSAFSAAKNSEPSAVTNLKMKNVKPKSNITNMQIVRSLKQNKRAKLQSAKVSSNMNNNMLLLMGVNSPKIKNDLSSHSILPPIAGTMKGNMNSNGEISKKQFSDKNPFSESISTNATALNSNQLNEKNATSSNSQGM